MSCNRTLEISAEASAALFDRILKQLPPFTNSHGWADMLNWAIAALHSQSDEDAYIEITNNPFGHLLAPMCAAAGLRIKRTLSRPAFAPLQRGILVRL